MSKALIDIRVITGIINAYTTAENKSRVYGLILGTQKDNIYRISEVIYGYIFEDGEDEKTHKKKYSRLNDETLKTLLLTLHQKFITSKNDNNILVSVKEKENLQDKDFKYKSVDEQMILGGFATDRELFNDLHQLYGTIDVIKDDVFKNKNCLLLLVDPNYQNKEKIEFGVKTYLWYMKYIKVGKSNFNRVLAFNEISSQVVDYLTNVKIIGQNNLDSKLYDVSLDKNDKKNLTELFLNTNESKNNVSQNNNVEYIKNKIEQSIEYLNVVEKVMENKENNKGKLDEKDYNQIAFILSKLEPIVSNEEIMSSLTKINHKNDNINSLTQLLQVQLVLANKIQKLVHE